MLTQHLINQAASALWIYVNCIFVRYIGRCISSVRKMNCIYEFPVWKNTRGRLRCRMADIFGWCEIRGHFASIFCLENLTDIRFFVYDHLYYTLNEKEDCLIEFDLRCKKLTWNGPLYHMADLPSVWSMRRPPWVQGTSSAPRGLSKWCDITPTEAI